MEECIEKIIKCNSYKIIIKIINDECIFYYKDATDEYKFKFNERGNLICWAYRPVVLEK